MPQQRVDLKSLLLMIKDNKEMEANYCLDEGCIIDTADVKPLVKVINYFLNYMMQITDSPVEVGLDLRGSNYLMTFMAYSQLMEFPDVSKQIDEILEQFHAKHEKVENPGKYCQLKIQFTRRDSDSEN